MVVSSGHLRDLLVRLSRAILLLQKAEGGCCGVTLAQCHMLVETTKGEAGRPLGVGQLAEALGVDLSTASRVADGLVRQKLLRRTSSKVDRRRSALSLTAEGRRLVDAINQAMDDYSAQVLAAVPSSRRKEVLESLEVLVEAVQQAGHCAGVDAVHPRNRRDPR
jgi:DNA-binding MarR family transcriptional regulator